MRGPSRKCMLTVVYDCMICWQLPASDVDVDVDAGFDAVVDRGAVFMQVWYVRDGFAEDPCEYLVGATMRNCARAELSETTAKSNRRDIGRLGR